jgi:hypothetical protein
MFGGILFIVRCPTCHIVIAIKIDCGHVRLGYNDILLKTSKLNWQSKQGSCCEYVQTIEKNM